MSNTLDNQNTPNEETVRAIFVKHSMEKNPELELFDTDAIITEVAALITAARIEEIEALYARADRDRVLRDKLDELYRMRYINLGGSNVFILDRIATLTNDKIEGEHGG